MGCLVGIIGLLFILFILWGFTVSPLLGIFLAAIFFGGGYYLVDEGNKKTVKNKNEKINKLHEMQMAVKDFTISQKFTSPEINSSILLDEEQKKVCFIFADTNTTEVYNYNEILESEILEDGKTVTSTSTSSQIGRAVLGGVIAGGAGAIIGGLGGKQTSDQEIYKIDLKVIVNNTKNPLKIINFLVADVNDLNGKATPIKKDEPKYKSAISTINHWHSLLSYLIKHSDQVVSSESVNNPSNLDEIRKLADLFKEGILTEEEFQQQKRKLLS